jgi:hypothetical protein
MVHMATDVERTPIFQLFMLCDTANLLRYWSLYVNNTLTSITGQTLPQLKPWFLQ